MPIIFETLLKKIASSYQKKVENTQLIVYIISVILIRSFRITVPLITTDHSSLIKNFIVIIVKPRKTNI